MSYGSGITLARAFKPTLDRVRAELQAEGFGIVSEIDMAATLREKVDADIGGYVILGACNPPLALRALQAVPSVGLLLPCNVVVRATLGGTVVEAVNPRLIATLAGVADLEMVADDAAERLDRVLHRLVASPGNRVGRRPNGRRPIHQGVAD